MGSGRGSCSVNRNVGDQERWRGMAGGEGHVLLCEVGEIRWGKAGGEGEGCWNGVICGWDVCLFGSIFGDGISNCVAE